MIELASSRPIEAPTAADGPDMSLIHLLWLTTRPPPALLSPDLPTYALRWPEFLGIWRRVGRATPMGVEA